MAPRRNIVWYMILVVKRGVGNVDIPSKHEDACLWCKTSSSFFFLSFFHLPFLHEQIIITDTGFAGCFSIEYVTDHPC